MSSSEAGTPQAGAPDAGAPEASTWVDGAEVDCPPQAWALRRAGFLGCGFRVVVPGGSPRRAALTRARTLAGEIAARLGARLDPAPWDALLAAPEASVTSRGTSRATAAEVPVEVCGGWTHQFRAPLGACATRVTPLPAAPAAPAATAATAATAQGRGVIVPWQVNDHAPLTGLPAISAHHEARALRWLHEQPAAEPGDVGLWTNSAGHLVDTTAGPPLLHTGDGWRHPVPAAGTVPHHLWERACARLRATPWDGSGPTALPDDVDALLCVAADGRLTRVTSVDGRRLDGAVAHAYAELG